MKQIGHNYVCFTGVYTWGEFYYVQPRGLSKIQFAQNLDLAEHNLFFTVCWFRESEIIIYIKDIYYAY